MRSKLPVVIVGMLFGFAVLTFAEERDQPLEKSKPNGQTKNFNNQYDLEGIKCWFPTTFQMSME